jgi:hypothetical protein
MYQLARDLIVVPIIGIALADCGSTDGPAPWDTDGGIVGSSGATTGGNGSVTSSGSSGGGARSNDGGPSLVLADGAVAGGGQEQCFMLNGTRSCCGGTQVCVGAGEFNYWGPCLDATGGPAVCPHLPPPCSATEGRPCDAGPPPPPPPPPAICNDPAISTEPEILVGYSPALGQTVGLHGQIKVWVNDENPPFIAPGEQVDPTTGTVLAPGNRIATAPDGLLWEPALYIAPQTPQNGGTPHVPQWFKGWIDNSPPGGSGGMQIPGMDPVPPGSMLAEMYTGEDIWDVSSLGLAPGTYTAVFVVHDGDDDRAIGCVTIVITP